jgi:hypothetical protein
MNDSYMKSSFMFISLSILFKCSRISRRASRRRWPQFEAVLRIHRWFPTAQVRHILPSSREAVSVQVMLYMPHGAKYNS